MSEFTQGRWKIRHGYEIIGKKWKGGNSFELVATVFEMFDKPKQAKANVRLIAAAPEMFDLLNQAFHALQRADIEEALRIEIDACLCHVEGTSVPGEEEEVKE